MNLKIEYTETEKKIYYTIEEKYYISYDKETQKYSDCTCPWGSYWGINKTKNQPCKHKKGIIERKSYGL